ncbi:MAG: acyltransferase family protein [Bacteroidales bacterium]|nr:acyltransferase family protein [Bacteroidales bacterium]
MSRDIYWDSLKGILIFLVVLGHTLEINLPDGSINRAVYNTIYLFHMPLFVFVSGRFSHIRDKGKYMRSIIHLIETYIVFQCVRSFLLPLLSGGEPLWKHIIVPNWIMWYLMSLVWWRLVIYLFLPFILCNKQKVLLISLIACVLGGFVPLGHVLEFQRTLVFFPFFLLGFYSTNIDVKNIVCKIPYGVAVTWLLLVFGVFYLLLNHNLSWLLSAGQHYWDVSPVMGIRVISRIVYIPFAFLACLMVIRLIKPNKFFSQWGGVTMFIFIYHTFVLDIVKEMVKNDIIINRPWILPIYALLVFIFVLLLSKVRFFNVLLNPISGVMHKKGYN